MPIELAMLRRFVVCSSAVLFVVCLFTWPLFLMFVLLSVPVLIAGGIYSVRFAREIAAEPGDRTLRFMGGAIFAILAVAALTGPLIVIAFPIAALFAIFGAVVFWSWNASSPLDAAVVPSSEATYIALGQRGKMVGRWLAAFAIVGGGTLLMTLPMSHPFPNSVAAESAIIGPALLLVWLPLVFPLIFFGGVSIFVFAEQFESAPLQSGLAIIVSTPLLGLAGANFHSEFWPGAGMVLTTVLIFVLWTWGRRRRLLSSILSGPHSPIGEQSEPSRDRSSS